VGSSVASSAEWSNYRWNGRKVAARRAAAASDMMPQRRGLPWWVGGRSTMR
jgi:hypothetical protein